MEFLKDQYRHGKTILALGASSMLLDKAAIPKTLPSGQLDPGILIGTSSPAGSTAKEFVAATGKHQHPERDSDPVDLMVLRERGAELCRIAKFRFNCNNCTRCAVRDACNATLKQATNSATACVSEPTRR